MDFVLKNMIGNKIRIARMSKGIKQQDFANLLGLSRVSLVNIEKNKHILNAIQIAKVCELLNVEPNFLFGVDNEISIEMPDSINKKVENYFKQIDEKILKIQLLKDSWEIKCKKSE